ncbi:sigma 54-interacting transcriptional regulator [Sorangium cellulosum]|nr:sigma 54-interacting transcriptional regulator [Sorangium cellulosum]
MEASAKTQSVLDESVEAPSVALLTHVLSYDDLTAAVSRAFVVLRRPGDEARVGRTAGPPGLARGVLGLRDPRMSSMHLVLRRHTERSAADGSTRFVDLIEDPLPGSKNGTYLNGHAIVPGTPIALKNGDLIEVGHTLLCYRQATDDLAVRLTESELDGVEFGPTRTRCPAVVRCVDTLASLAPTELRVLFTGETGVGKESAAVFVHQKSHRAKGRWLAVNCAAISSGLFESAFFGHVRGAFTSAVGQAAGFLTQAHGGTLFLDELGSLAPDHQAKLLRVIETGLFRRVGSDKDEKIDVRWVAATNEDLSTRVRGDLLFRVRQHEICLPPLGQRREDMGALIASFLADLRRTNVRVSITPLAARRLCCAPYPGNIRQLGAVVRAATATAGVRDGAVTITGSSLPSDLTIPAPAANDLGPPRPPITEAPPAVDPHEQRFSEAVLRRALEGRTKAAAAVALRISVRHLDRLLLRFGLAERYRRR